MTSAHSKKRMLENEVFFRERNESINERMEALKEIAKEDGQEHLVPNDDTALSFYCECSDENCNERVLVKPSRYEEIHHDRRHFIVINGHETDAVERIIRKEGGFSIVEKYRKPPATSVGLQPTPVHNV